MRPLLLLLCLWSALAAANGPREAAARHFRLGEEDFRAGRLESAIAHFTDAYAASPRPELLLNLAQCHRAAGRPQRAVEYLERFLEEAPTSHRLRPAAMKTLEELRPALPPATSPPSDAPLALQRTFSPQNGPAAHPGAAPPAATAEPPQPSSAKWWLIGGSAAVVAVAAGVAAYLLIPRPPPSVGTVHVPP